jgi:hypothetical protein
MECGREIFVYVKFSRRFRIWKMGGFGGEMNFGVAMKERSLCEYLSRACAHLN